MEFVYATVLSCEVQLAELWTKFIAQLDLWYSFQLFLKLSGIRKYFLLRNQYAILWGASSSIFGKMGMKSGPSCSYSWIRFMPLSFHSSQPLCRDYLVHSSLADRLWMEFSVLFFMAQTFRPDRKKSCLKRMTSGQHCCKSSETLQAGLILSSSLLKRWQKDKASWAESRVALMFLSNVDLIEFIIHFVFGVKPLLLLVGGIRSLLGYSPFLTVVSHRWDRAGTSATRM